MKIFAKDKVVFNFSKTNQPVYFVEPGETFWVETDDCYSGQIKTETVLRPDKHYGLFCGSYRCERG